MKINVMDTPGYSDFAGEVDAAVRVCEGAIIVVAASSGVEVGTDQHGHIAKRKTGACSLLIKWIEKMPILIK